MSIIPISACSLHVPYKEWSTSHEEKTNYDVIERWARQILSCYAIGRHVGGGSVFSAVNRSWFIGTFPATPTGTNLIDFNTFARSDVMGTHITLPAPGTPGITLNADGILLLTMYASFPGPAITGNEYNIEFNDGLDTHLQNVRTYHTANSAHSTDFGMGGGYFIQHGGGDTFTFSLFNGTNTNPMNVSVEVGVTLLELA